MTTVPLAHDTGRIVASDNVDVASNWFDVIASIDDKATNCSPAFKAGLLRQRKVTHAR